MEAGTQGPVTAVVFDLGGVLVDWDPRHLYRKLIPDRDAMERFLGEVCSPEWHAPFDLGAPMAEAIADLARRHPGERHLIEAYGARWAEMFGGAIEDSVEILQEVRARVEQVYALSNWPAETFPQARARFTFLDLFDGIVISGAEGVKKPDAELFRILLERYALEPHTTLFIDDVPANLTAAEALGLHTLAFTSAERLRADLARFGLP